MLPFLSMRLYSRGNNLNLSKHIEKLKNGQLTIENVLEEDDIIQDLKLNTNSQFISMLSNEAIRKLMDYATRMPSSDDQKIGHKYPFNATEILCADNSCIQERIMNEINFKESDFYEQLNENKEEDQGEKKEEIEVEEDKKEEKNVDEQKEEKPEGKIEAGEKKEESGFVSGLNDAINKAKEEQKNKINEKTEHIEKTLEEKKPEEINTEKKEEIKKEEENKKEEPKPEEKREESKQEEELKNEEEKTEEKKEDSKKEVEEPKKEEVKEEPKPEAKNGENKQEEKKEEDKKEEQNQEIIQEETKKEEPKKEEQKQEEPKNDESKQEEPKKEEEKSEQNNLTEKKDEVKPEEIQSEDLKEEAKPTESQNEANTEEKEDEEVAKKEGENEEDEEEEKGQHKHIKDDEDEDNQRDNEENEDSENGEDVKVVTIYDNIDYLFTFLKESKETVSNHVLVGYFYKILNHLIRSQAIKIVQYIFDYPKKSKFDLLNAIVTHLNRKSMGSIVNKLLLFSDESNDLTDKKLLLATKMLEELEKTVEKDKYECICEVLASTLSNKTFYISFMNDPKLVELLFCLLEKSVENPKKLICVMNLLIKVNENVLKNLSSHCTKNLVQENPLDFMSLFNCDTTYPLDEKQISNEEMEEINKSVLLSLFTTLKKTEFKFFEDLGVYNQDNEEFITTYQQKQKKLGMKKLAQIEFLRTILDIFVNSYNSQFHEKTIEELIEILKNKNVFYNCHKLFFDFPFSNIYQTFYSQIIDIVINQSSPECLIEFFFKYSDEKGEKNLVSDLMDHYLNNLKFTFNSSNISFNPCSSYEVSLLNKFYKSDNENVKKLFNNDNNLKVFDEVLGEEINHIFEQKLLLSDNLGANLGEEDEKPLQTFGKSNFMEIIDEDISIYNTYKNGGDYKTQLNEKIEREKSEREKMEQEIVGEEEENKDEHINQDEDEENEEGIEEIGVDKEGEEEGKDANNGVEEVEQKDDEEKEKDNIEEKNELSDDKKSESTEESIEEKNYNDVNFWDPGIKPTDDIMSAMLNDIE